MKEEFLWVEKYRPKIINECILPDKHHEIFDGILKKGKIPNMILSGSAGIGKTTVARALCNELDYEYIIINGSKDNGIDVLRSTVTSFASSKTFDGRRKAIIFDEADYMNANSLQPALRAAIEEFSNNCTFIFTCNYPTRLIEPLHSRCPIIDFSIDEKTDKVPMMKKFYARLLDILKKENVEFEPKVVGAVMVKYFPDFRRILGELQKYSNTGKIDTGIFSSGHDNNFEELVSALKDKNFEKVQQWVAGNVYSDSNTIYTKLYKEMKHIMNGEDYARAILIIQQYQYESAFCANQEIAMIACLIRIMVDCEFR